MCPSDKHPYLSWKQAERARHGLRRGRSTTADPYHCPDCEMTHLGKLEHAKRPRKMKPYRRRQRAKLRAKLREVAA